MRLGKTDSDFLSMISTLMKGTGTFTDDQIDFVLLMPVGSSFGQHIDNLVSRGEITESEKGQILDFYRVATSADKWQNKFPEDDMNLPDSNGNMTTLTNKNYWWLYLALGVGLGLMFKKK